MGERPTPDHSIDRKNNDGPYSPDNCVWSARRSQARNRRTNHRLELDGIARTLAEWAAVTGLHPATIETRIRRHRWSVRDALTRPIYAPR